MAIAALGVEGVEQQNSRPTEAVYLGSRDATMLQGRHRKISMAGRSPDIGIVLIRSIGASH